MAVMSVGLTAAVPHGAAAADKPVKVIVLYEVKPGKAEAARLKRQHKAKVRYRYDNIPAIAATIPRGELKALRSKKKVKRVELDHQLVLFDHGTPTGDPELENGWGVWHIGAGRVHQAGNQGKGIRAAIVDTGIDCSHPDLDANCDGGISYIPSAPFPGGVPIDDYGHGTHVSGIMAAEKNAGGVVGVAPKVKLFAMKVLDSTGEGDYSGLIAALDQIATWNTDGDPANDIDVVNMSIGGHEPSAALQAAVQAAHASGAILVGASGNVNPFDFLELFYGCPVVYPARYPEVLATTFTNGGDALTGYSCTGAEVDFAAPGDLVNSTVPTSGPLSSPSGYLAASGTSMASPHLAGTVALLLSHGIADTNGNGRQDEIVTHLCANTKQGFGVLSTPIPPSDPRYPEYFGCGVVDAGAALVDDPPGGPPPPPPNDPPNSDAGGPYDGSEGSAVALDGTASDPDGDPTTKSWTWQAGGNVDPGASCAFGDATKADTTVTCTDDGTFTLTLSVDDGTAPPVSGDATLTLGNADPSATIDAPSGGASYEVGETVSVSRTVSDAGQNDSRTCQIDWGDGDTTNCSTDHTYGSAEPAVTITLTVTDDDGGVGSDQVGISITEPPPPPTTETLTFTPVADAFVNSKRPSRNYGSARRLQVKDGARRSFVRFEVSGVDGEVVAAKLRLYLANSVSEAGTARIVASTTWAEGTITWNDQPEMGQALSTAQGAARGTWVEFDVTGAIDGDGAHSFAISNGSSDTAKYHSREAAKDPQLVLTVK